MLGPVNIGAAVGFVEGAGPGRRCIFLRPNGVMLQLVFCFATTVGDFCWKWRSFLLEICNLLSWFCYIPYQFLLQPVTIFAETWGWIFFGMQSVVRPSTAMTGGVMLQPVFFFAGTSESICWNL